MTFKDIWDLRLIAKLMPPEYFYLQTWMISDLKPSIQWWHQFENPANGYFNDKLTLEYASIDYHKARDLSWVLFRNSVSSKSYGRKLLGLYYRLCNLNWTLYLWDFYIFRCLYQLLKSYFVHNEDNSNFSSLPIRRVSELNYSWISFWTDFKSQKWSWWQSDLTATVKEFGRNLSIHNDDSNEFELTKEPSRKPMLLSLM